METNPRIVEDAISNVHKDEWLEAMQSKYNSLEECET